MTQMCLEERSHFIPFVVGIAVNGSRRITARARTQSMPMGMPPGSRQGSYVGHGYMYPSYAQIQRGSDNPRVHSGSAELLTVGAVLITVRKRWADAGMALAAGPAPCQRLASHKGFAVILDHPVPLSLGFETEIRNDHCYQGETVRGGRPC